MTAKRVILVSNDVLPGMGLPVAAPGLRVWGLAEGLRKHGFDVTEVALLDVIQTLWPAPTIPASREGTVILKRTDLSAYLEGQQPAVVIMTNSNQVDFVVQQADLRFIIDFFAPKMLEISHAFGEEHPMDELRTLRRRKIKAIELADGFIVNGAKKFPYFLAWLLQGDRDTRSLPIEVVNMAIPPMPRDMPQSDVFRLTVAGYLQGWSTPGVWLERVLDHLEVGRVELDLLLPVHWGQSGTDIESPILTRAADHPAVTKHDSMLLSDFRSFMSRHDAALDLFEYSLEREYAMITRTVMALSCGVPAVHPPFSEVSPFIADYDAGWLLDPHEPDGIDDFMNSLSRSEIEAKARGAEEAANEVFEPRKATQPLADMIHGF